MMVRPIGFALAFGVLVDAFVVRMTLDPGGDVPARRQRLVAAPLAGPDAAGRRRRGRQARRAPRVRCAGRRAHGIPEPGTDTESQPETDAEPETETQAARV